MKDNTKNTNRADEVRELVGDIDNWARNANPHAIFALCVEAPDGEDSENRRTMALISEDLVEVGAALGSLLANNPEVAEALAPPFFTALEKSGVGKVIRINLSGLGKDKKGGEG